MRKLLIFGNSGSGKSTLAKRISKNEYLAHLDLDILAWQDTYPPTRQPIKDSQQKIQAFTSENDTWVIEGCYADLLELAASEANEIIFLDLPVSACIENARNRPWERHKYASKEEQDENFDMLIDWIAEYDERKDMLSRHSHQALYDAFVGKKTVLIENA
jgi:adenylate kinase family enzyme